MLKTLYKGDQSEQVAIVWLDFIVNTPLLLKFSRAFQIANNYLWTMDTQKRGIKRFLTEAMLISPRKVTKRAHLEHKEPTLVDKKHKCHMCQRQFYARRVLVLHILCVHENRGPYDCSLCPNAYIRLIDLESHRQREHKECFDSPSQEPSIEQLLQRVIDSGFFEQNFGWLYRSMYEFILWL